MTLRSEECRRAPWKGLFRSLYNAVISATADQLGGLRTRKLVAVQNA